MAKKEGGKKNTVEEVWKLAEPIAAQLGLQLWDVQFVKEGVLWYLRLFIDKESGVTIDDCVDMSHALDHPLDVANLIDQAYHLEVSSPGIERALTRPEHFRMLEGCAVVLHRIRPDANGERDIAGILVGLQEDTATVTVTTEEGTPYTVSRKELSSVRLIDDFEDEDTEEEL